MRTADKMHATTQPVQPTATHKNPTTECRAAQKCVRLGTVRRINGGNRDGITMSTTKLKASVVSLSVSQPVHKGQRSAGHLSGVEVGHTKLYSFRFNCRIVSLTAANTNRMFSVSVAHVKCE